MKNSSEMKPARQLVGIVAAASDSIESWFAVGHPSVALDSATGAAGTITDLYLPKKI